MRAQEIFAANVRSYRKSQGMTQAELAEAAAMSVEMIGKIERGSAAPSMGAIDAIATALRTSVGALFGGVPAADADDAERARAIAGINALLSKASDEELRRLTRMIRAYLESAE